MNQPAASTARLETQTGFWSQLRRDLERGTLDTAEAQARTIDGIRVSRSKQTLTLALEPALDAVPILKALEIPGEIFVVSTDVHQKAWKIVAKTGDVPSTGRARISVAAPRIGDRDLGLFVAGRPTGELPPTVAGASPAYPLVRYPGRIQRIEIPLTARP